MATVKDMLDSNPAGLGTVDRDALARCIAECERCAQACTMCADSCLSEENVEDLARCVRLDLDCADVCDITARLLSRHTGHESRIARAQLQACAVACATCAEECERHAAAHEHCRFCAEACRACETACRDLIASGI
ncbi:four-helix bundle copper-binding protein [Streptomyces sp. 7-21]|uniref:four-helix bundle copper-binding protein n=1 Tax=Streptomyces sp. 7-21 TaxID=2802283 RepID=UPI00191D2C3C|nr:four-helix bundle copper-binding protein [Streptomyces sp. 7-21]MBL1065099.1 four-helix bundle copper-binding protein [Streptomyces sp. 7-21]